MAVTTGRQRALRILERRPDGCADGLNEILACRRSNGDALRSTNNGRTCQRRPLMRGDEVRRVRRGIGLLNSRPWSRHVAAVNAISASRKPLATALVVAGRDTRLRREQIFFEAR